MILDDSERIKLNSGDVFIQRGTIHGWHNEGAEWCRVFAVMLRESLTVVRHCTTELTGIASKLVKAGDVELQQEP